MAGPRGFPRGSVVKNPPADTGDVGSIPAWEDRETETAIPSTILAWETPWTEEPGGPQSMGSHGVAHSN